MKKITIAISLFVLAAGLVIAAPVLKVVTPNGGEVLTLGEPFQITWTATGVTQKIKLVLIKSGGALVGIIDSNLDAKSCIYNWPAGQHKSGMAAAGDNYKIRICTMDNTLEDLSDRAFTLGGQAASPSLKVTFPVGGETFTWGSLQPFQWSAPGSSGSVKVTLMRNGSPAYELSPSVSVAAGAVGWTIGDAPGWSCDSRCGAGYKLRVEALDGSASAESPGTFTIAAAPPSGGGEPDFELNPLDRYFVWKIDPQHGGKVLTIEIYINWYNHGADYQGPLKVHYMYLDALQGSKISKDAVLEIPSVSIAHNKGRKDHLCTVEKIPDGVSSITFAVMLDPDNQVKETDEKNNYRDLNVELSHQPDLAIEDVRYSTTEFHNYDPVDVYFTVRNKGIEQARQFNVRVTGDDEKGNILAYKNSMTIPLLGGCNDASGPPSHLPRPFPDPIHRRDATQRPLRDPRRLRQPGQRSQRNEQQELDPILPAAHCRPVFCEYAINADASMAGTYDAALRILGRQQGRCGRGWRLCLYLYRKSWFS